MIWLRYSGTSEKDQTRSYRFWTYPLIDVRDSSVATQRSKKGIVRSLCSDRTCWFCRYLATERVGSVATFRSLRSNRTCWFGRYVATLFLCFFERVLGLPVFSFDGSTRISARFYRKVSRRDFFTKITFSTNVHADFYGHLDVNFVVTVFDRNTFPMFSDNRCLVARLRLF